MEATNDSQTQDYFGVFRTFRDYVRQSVSQDFDYYKLEKIIIEAGIILARNSKETKYLDILLRVQA